jgi:hypothetical protein
MGNLCSSPKDFFDFEYYKRHNTDIAEVYGNDYNGLWKHWCKFGYKECREHRFMVYVSVAKACCPPPSKPPCCFDKCGRPNCDVKLPDPRYRPKCPKPDHKSCSDYMPIYSVAALDHDDYPCVEHPRRGCGCKPGYYKKDNGCGPTDGYAVSAKVLNDAVCLEPCDFLEKYAICVPHERKLALALLKCVQVREGCCDERRGRGHGKHDDDRD